MLRMLFKKNRNFNNQFEFSRVRSLKLSTTRILLANGADPNLANNRGETATSIAEFLQPDQQQDFLNILHRKYLNSYLIITVYFISDTPQIASTDPHLYKTGKKYN